MDLHDYQIDLLEAQHRGDLAEIKAAEKELKEYRNNMNRSTSVPATPKGSPKDATKGKKQKVKKGKKAKKDDWGLCKQTSAIWLKFYAEQVGCAGTVQEQIDALKAFLTTFSAGMHPFYFHAIIHYKDTNKPENDEEFWYPSLEKPHCHLLIFYVDRKADGRRKQIRFDVLINYLLKFGLAFRHDKDTSILRGDTRFPILRNHDESRIIAYHTHETYDARETDGKEQYDRAECFTNIPADVLESHYKYYFAHQDASADEFKDMRAPTMATKDNYNKMAYDLGCSGGDFDEFWFSLPTAARLERGLKSVCREAYEQGVSQFIKGSESINHKRCAIFIFGPHGCGKSHTAEAALKSMGINTHVVDAGGTGKLDELRPSHKALIVNDTAIKNILAMADDRFCRAYRRGSNNPLFTGDYYVVTYNRDLSLYLKDFYSGSIISDSQRLAVMSRFYLCRCDKDGLHLIKPAQRADKAGVESQVKMFADFQHAFNKIHAGFVPATDDDIDALLDKYGVVR